MVGQYHKYIVFAITDVVLAEYINLTVVGPYHIYILNVLTTFM